MNSQKNIESVVRAGLCTGCGTCVALCPNLAIQIFRDNVKGIYLANIDPKKCNNCGICIQVCPGASLDFNKLNRFVYGKLPDNILLGNFIEGYIGNSKDNEIRWNSSSGGLVTTLLVYLIEEGIINGALVTRMGSQNPLEPEVIIARTKEEIKSASQSKYCPVPVNTALKKIIDENLKVAVVGLPCHIQGMRKAEIINRKLRENIIIHIGLFCGHNVNFLGTEYVLKKIGIDYKDIKKISYRGYEYPGIMVFELIDGRKKMISHLKFWRLLFAFNFFCPIRCTLCCDPTSEFADLSIGSAWLPELRKDKIKKNICLSRTRQGQELLKNAKLNKKIDIEKIDFEKIINFEKTFLYFNKKSLKARLNIMKKFRRGLPKYNVILLEPNIIDYITSLWLYFRLYISFARARRLV